LQASSWGNPFFYFDYGVVVPDEVPASREILMGIGWIKYRRLKFEDLGAFPCGTKAEIDQSAQYALDAYKKVALPWLEQLTIDEVLNGKL